MQKADVQTRSSFVGVWQSSMRIHDIMGENRIRFAQKLNEMSDELSNLVKEVEKTRKQVKTIESYSTSTHRLNPTPLSPRRRTLPHDTSAFSKSRSLRLRKSRPGSISQRRSWNACSFRRRVSRTRTPACGRLEALVASVRSERLWRKGDCY